MTPRATHSRLQVFDGSRRVDVVDLSFEAIAFGLVSLSREEKRRASTRSRDFGAAGHDSRSGATPGLRREGRCQCFSRFRLVLVL